ncbi:hypothetical protein [Streptomyces sp. NBC_00620]|uniref:hypothetical protein n=1 Tax=Streptomyces sp. NBC_00620 TaxID=2903666 RepID=UPI00224C7F5A|nr:hypothetical protein [Streptomyces sp. NBC_00620]MCX4973597.1 hypothetical protein [Streptomyces sp. NBC_00620]
MITAFARAQGSTPASPATAALERTPTPPPNRTNRAKEASGPGRAGAAGVTGVCEGTGVTGTAWVTGVTGSRRTPIGSVSFVGWEPRAANAVSGFDRSSAVMGDSFRAMNLWDQLGFGWDQLGSTMS